MAQHSAHISINIPFTTASINTCGCIFLLTLVGIYFPHSSYEQSHVGIYFPHSSYEQDACIRAVSSFLTPSFHPLAIPLCDNVVAGHKLTMISHLTPS